MAQGTVKWFKNEKGFGFISMDGEEEVFLHYSQIQAEEPEVCPTCGQVVK